MDVTERNQAQEALQQAQAELAHVTRVTTLGELTASIAHEVNQPLAAIVTNGQACLRWLGHDPPQLGRGARRGQAHRQRRRSRERGDPADSRAFQEDRPAAGAARI